MRVCLVTPYGLGQVAGVSTMVLDLAGALRDRGHAITIIAPPPPPSERLHGITSLIVPVGRTFGNFRLAWRVSRLLWRNRFEWDLVHNHQGHPQTVAAALLARLLGKPAVATFHLRPPRARGLRGLVEALAIRILLKASTVRAFVSSHTRSTFSHPGAVVHNGIDAERVRHTLGRRADLRRELSLSGFVLAFAGRQAKIKGFGELLKAIQRVRLHGADVRLLATGSMPADEQRAMEGLAQELGLVPVITNLGMRADHLRYLAAADTFVLPSHLEGLPIGLLEAMAAGLPVIASRVGGIPEVVTHGREGLLVEPGDIDALADSIHQLALNPQLRSEMTGRAIERANALSVASMTSAYEHIYIREVSLRAQP